jgi:O-antigen ligase
MIYLNYLYFLIISLLGFLFLFGSGIVVRHPLDRSQQMKLNGPESLWLLTFSTGLLAFSAGFFGLNLMALRLFVLEGLCLLGLFVSKKHCSNLPVFSAAMWAYIIYLVWIIIGCFYSPSFSYGIRVVLKYLYPFLLCLFASATVRDGELFIKSGQGAALLGVIYLVFSFVPGLYYLVPGVFWYGTASAINLISLMIFCLTLFFFTDAKSKYFILTLLFFLPCFIWVFRTSILGTIVALGAFFFIKYRLKSLPILFAIGIAGVVAVFTIPRLHDKMFNQRQDVTLEKFEQGKVTIDDVHGNGREMIWETLDNKFYKGHEIAGSGTGAVQHFLYQGDFMNGLNASHGDFVQQRCDNGIIGLVLYALVALFIFLHSFKVYHSTDDVPLKMCALTAGATMMGVYATLLSDNVVNYSMATLSMPFGFYGMMLGMLQKQRGDL